MTKRLPFWVIILLLTATALLGACGGTPGRADDAVLLPENVPAEPTGVPQTTSLPSEPSTGALPNPSQPATGAPPAPAGNGPVLIFEISGGIAGFCDELDISRNGNYTLRICGQDDIVGILEQADQDSLQTWYENLAGFRLTFEDNPGGPDNMVTNLTFKGQGEIEADDVQQQVILDWISGLAIRLRPQPEPDGEPPTPVAVAVGPGGLCPDIARPALLTINYDNPGALVLVDPASRATCNILLSQLPVGRIAAAAGSIFYLVFDPEAQTTTVWQLDANGQEMPLPFTSVAMEEPGPYDFVISDNGTKIAWAQTVIDFETDPPLYRNNLWVANIDGNNQVTVLDQVENSEIRFVAHVRISSNGETLYYALQPDIGGPVLSGRFDTLYGVSTTGGQAQLLYACPVDNPVCIGGLSPDGNILTVIQPAEGSIQVLNRDGTLVNMLSLPATDYVERTAFGPGGNLAFVTATLSRAGQGAPPLPSPGYISFAASPHTGQPQTLLSNNNIGTLQGWLDENRLVYGSIDQEGNTATFILTLNGDAVELTPNIAVAVLR